jgi:uncharacterized protein involved in type VI secretion and phage assembly
MALPAPADGGGPGYFGVYPAIVTNLVDPDNLGRIEVRFPTLGTDGDRDVRGWATLCSPYADDDQGLQILPEERSQVVVAFEAGNFRRPYILGASWNGKAKLPRRPDKPNNIRVLRSRGESEIEFDDTMGSEKVSITMKSGKGHRIVLDAGKQEVTIQHSNGSVIRMTLAGSIEIQSTLSVDIKTATLNVTAPISMFNGVVQCKTLMTDAFVISPAYTPGVGNLL